MLLSLAWRSSNIIFVLKLGEGEVVKLWEFLKFRHKAYDILGNSTRVPDPADCRGWNQIYGPLPVSVTSQESDSFLGGAPEVPGRKAAYQTSSI